MGLNPQQTHCFDQVVSFLVLKIVVYQRSPVGFVVCKMALGEKLSVFVDLTYWPISMTVDLARLELLIALFMKAQVISYVTPCRLVNTDFLRSSVPPQLGPSWRLLTAWLHSVFIAYQSTWHHVFTLKPTVAILVIPHVHFTVLM